MKSAHDHAPLNRPFFTPGVIVLIALMTIGACFALARFVFGLSAITNLDNQHPWGIWIAVDVASGVALAAGGFTTAALVYIFNRAYFHQVIRPALLTAWLGYLFVSIGLMADLGRYYSIWHPMVYWQGNSVLFEVGICVMTYLTVLTIEFLPIVLEAVQHYIQTENPLTSILQAIQQPAERLQRGLHKVMPLFILAGVLLSFMHQSSLGTLMLIAPSKLNPLWFTPILPLLFLLSAIMVGFPMVLFESLIASRSFGHKPETHVLIPLARYIPYTLGLYLVFKLGDFFIRQPYASLQFDVDTVAFLVEIGAGLILPLILLLLPQTRNSITSIFIASSLLIFGVVLNRINVFLVGYNPPFAETTYFPSIGEIAITTGLISAILFFYRLIVTFLPVLPHTPSDSLSPCSQDQGLQNGISPSTATAILALVLSFSFVAPQTGFSQTQTKMETMPSLLLLDTPSLNASSDHYGTVRFMHKKHASLELGDCTVCHHRVPAGPNDTIGKPIHRADLLTHDPVACRTCHSAPLQPEAPGRPGLKGALHQRCMDCHEERQAGPVDCTSCHRRHVPNHKEFVKLQGPVTPQQVTDNCLSCHPTVSHAILHSAHWNWAGLSPDTVGHENETTLGKTVLINNYCIHVGSNLERCTMCHIGYGWKDDTFDFSNASNIDCLVCHDTTGSYKKAPPKAGMPEEGVDLIAVAQQVGHPDRGNCGACHFYGGGADGVKHGDMDSSLYEPSPELDVHMGKHGFVCQDCHITQDHQIAGACATIPAREGRVSCQDCHTEAPHSKSGLMGHHLNSHSKTIECQTCHIPQFARGNPTKMSWDWSTAGQDRPSTKDEYGKPTYEKMKGDFTWAKFVTPEYKWDNGTHDRYLEGDPIAEQGATILNTPLGSIQDPAAKIAPYKVHEATQISDTVHRHLIIPNLWKGYWSHYDWDRASRDGMKAVGLPYSGQYEFVPTTMYWKINHQVTPKTEALSCYQCHTASASCLTCHTSLPEKTREQMQQLDTALHQKAAANGGFPFMKLGYSCDPIHYGSRFTPLASQ